MTRDAAFDAQYRAQCWEGDLTDSHFLHVLFVAALLVIIELQQQFILPVFASNCAVSPELPYGFPAPSAEPLARIMQAAYLFERRDPVRRTHPRIRRARLSDLFVKGKTGSALIRAYRLNTHSQSRVVVRVFLT